MDFITKYKDCEIWFDEDKYSTAPSSRWVIQTKPQARVVIYLDGTRTIEEVKRYIDVITRIRGDR